VEDKKGGLVMKAKEKTCQTCQHWQRLKAPSGYESPYGKCQHQKHEGLLGVSVVCEQNLCPLWEERGEA
jgi:hypothetical protein